jgi:galactose mutarotase-like enzyme
VRNPGAEPLPFSFGYHPAFAWPLPGGAEGRAPARLRAGRAAAGAPRQQGRRADPAAGRADAGQGPRSCAGSALFEADALIWDDLHSRALAYGAYGGAWLDIAFPDTPQLGLWQVPGARYICIEPWAGHADPEGFAGEISDKPGIILLPPGEARSFRMDVALRPL